MKRAFTLTSLTLTAFTLTLLTLLATTAVYPLRSVAQENGERGGQQQGAGHGQGRGDRQGGGSPQGGQRNQGGPPPVYRTETPNRSYDAVAGLITRTGVTFSVLCNADRKGRLLYGTAPDKLTKSLPEVTFTKGEPRELTLTGLTPGTRHFWQVRFDDGTVTPQRTFTTVLPPGKPFTFTIQADSHLDGGSVADVYLRSLALASETDFLVDLGDTFMTDKYRPYTDSHPQYLAQRYYFGQAQVPVLMAPGNHDGERGADPEMLAWSRKERLRHFPSVPVNYWAYECGDALLVGLDPYSFTTDRPRRGGPSDGISENWYITLGKQQYDWLRKTLETSRARWKFVFIHNLVGGLGRDQRGGAEAAPFWEWGGKNAEGVEQFAEKRPGWGLPIHALLKKYGVAAVFHGHDHVYAYQEYDSIVYQCVPQPSHGRGGGSQSAPEYGYKQGSILDGSGILKVSVSPEKARVVFVRTDRPGTPTESHSYELKSLQEPKKP
jgi:predicted phosphodiesterase